MFLDVLVEKSNKKFIISVYRKPTFMGQYMHWDSFGPKKKKTNFIYTLELLKFSLLKNSLK